MDSLGASLNPGDKNTLNKLLAEFEIDMKGKDAEKIRAKMQEVESALNGIVRQHQEAGAQQGHSSDSDVSGPEADADDDVVDAEFEEN